MKDVNRVVPGFIFLGFLLLIAVVFSTSFAQDSTWQDTTWQNQAPVFSSTPKTDAEAGTAYLYFTSASDDHDQVLTYTLETGPSGMVFVDTSGMGCYMVWTPASDDAGDHAVVIRATDSEGLYGEQSFVITVTAPDSTPPETTIQNQAPVFSSTPNTDAEAGTEYMYFTSAADDNDQVLTYTLETGPSGMVFVDTSGMGCYMLWTPGTGDAGDHAVVIRATDSEGLYGEQSFVITVTAPDSTPPDTTVLNQAPVAVISGQLNLVDEDGDGQAAVTLYNQSYDPDGTILYSIWFDSLIGIYDTAAVLTVTLPVGEHPIYLFTVDNEHASGHASVTVTVSAAPADSSYTAPVDTSGGTVTDTSTGTTVDIPAGALVEAIVVEIVPVADPGDSSVYTAINFNVVGNPNGYTFSAPVTITLKYAPGKVTDPANLYIAYFNEATGEWEAIAGSIVDQGSHTVSAAVGHFSMYGIQEAGGGLPVVMSRFSASVSAGGVELSWRTESEENNLGFDVYRADDPAGDFVKVNGALIPGAGTTSGVSDYAWTDTGISAGTWYYRLAMKSATGELEYSDVLPVTVSGTGIRNLSAARIRRLPAGSLLHLDGTMVAPGTKLQPGVYLVRQDGRLYKTVITR